jgi:LuxR family transcriptional regulator, maltose regulon positive regulatory protein
VPGPTLTWQSSNSARSVAPAWPVAATPALYQGLARVLCGDLDGGDEALQDAASVGEKADAPETLAVELCERSLVAMTRGEWDQAEALSQRARTTLRRAIIEESFVTPLICAVHARAAWHRGDIPAARQELVRAQRSRHLLTYALPLLAVQARIARRLSSLSSRPGRRRSWEWCAGGPAAGR